MRTVIIILSLLAANIAVSAHKDRIERPRTLAVNFATGESVTFVISNSIVTAISIRIGSSNHTVPPSECAKLHDVRFETASFLWNGSHNTAASADYFYLRFEMGPESAKAFGELPRVQLMFRRGRFAEITIRKKIGDGTYQDSKL
jgi:hypothetical protein